MDRLTELTNMVLRYGSHKKYKILSYDKLETMCQTCHL